MPGPIIVGPAGVGTGSNRSQYRRALGDQLGALYPLVVTGTPDAVVTPDAKRIVLCETLRDDEWPEDTLQGAWVYAVDGTNAEQQKRVRGGGFDGPNGALELSSPFSNVLATGTTIELSSPLPCGRYALHKGLNEIINEALERINIEARISFTGNGTRSYDLDGYPQIYRREQIIGIYDRLGLDATENTRRSAYGVSLNRNGRTIALETELAYQTTETFELCVVVRGTELIRSGPSGTWALTTTGLENESQEAAAPVNWVVAVGMVKALQHLTKLMMMQQRMDPKEKQLRIAEYMAERKRWAATARAIVVEQFPRQYAARSEAMNIGPKPTFAPSSVNSGPRRWP